MTNETGPESGTNFGFFPLLGGVDSVEDGKKRQLKTELEASDLWIWIWDLGPGTWDLDLDLDQGRNWEKRLVDERKSTRTKMDMNGRMEVGVGVAANDRSDAIINKFQVIPDAELEGRVKY